MENTVQTLQRNICFDIFERTHSRRKPLVTIWFSAQLLNELAGSRNPAALRNWVLLTLGATAVIMLLNAILQHWREAEESTFYANMQSVFGKKRLDMDFPNADSQQRLRASIADMAKPELHRIRP